MRRRIVSSRARRRNIRMKKASNLKEVGLGDLDRFQAKTGWNQQFSTELWWFGQLTRLSGRQ
jgi:hypothetical protein